MLHDAVNDHWVHVHTNRATMLTVKKSAEWCSISMHACGSVSMVIRVYLAVAAGALLQRWLYNKCFQKNGRKE